MAEQQSTTEPTGAGGIRLRILRNGPLATQVLELGEGPPVVLLHAGGVRPDAWREVMERLAAGGFRALAPAFLGYGQSSPWPDRLQHDFAVEEAQIDALLDELGGPIALVGHSYGAAIGARLAARRRQIERLVLIEPPLVGVLFETGDEGALEQVAAIERSLAAEDPARGIREEWLAWFVDFSAGRGTFASLPAARQLELRELRNELFFEVRALARDRAPSSALASLPPTLMLHGARSPRMYRVSPPYLAARLPEWRCHAIAGAGHFAPLSHPAEVARLIAEELRAPVWRGA